MFWVTFPRPLAWAGMRPHRWRYLEKILKGRDAVKVRLVIE